MDENDFSAIMHMIANDPIALRDLLNGQEVCDVLFNVSSVCTLYHESIGARQFNYFH